MADNLTAPADGAVLATDEIGGAHYPRSKVGFGTDGVYADVAPGNPLPVKVDALGEAVAAPAANSALGRLKAIADAITAQSAFVDGLEALATQLNGFVDGLEGLLGGVATQATLAGIEGKLPTLGAKAASGSVSTTPSTDQDPVFDHANGVRAAVGTASGDVITPPAGCKYLRVHADGDCFIRTDGAAAADAAGSVKLLAGQPETIPVVAGTKVTAIAGAATVLRATPMKAR